MFFDGSRKVWRKRRDSCTANANFLHWPLIDEKNFSVAASAVPTDADQWNADED